MMKYKDASAPIEERVADLLGRMTLKEKFTQITMWQADLRILFEHLDKGTLPEEGIGFTYIWDRIDVNDINRLQRHQVEETRLGIPFILAGEAIHGLMYTGATIFPEAIALGATFDEGLIYEIADVIGRESETVGVRQNYAPNLDITRDPRWGRAEENYGEDPYLTGCLGTAYVKAMQSHNVAASPKHYIAHGIPEGGINCSPTHAGEREVREVMLEPFERTVKEGHAMSLMPAYSELDGVPMHASSYWLRDVLRGELGFDGFVVSDHGAIQYLRGEHHVAGDRLEAGMIARRAGVDMEAANIVGFSPELMAEVEEGRFPLSLIDEAVTNVLRVKFRLGLFEQPYAYCDRVGELNSPASRKIALRAAEESAVLLKNNGILPLSDTIGKVAVVGPGAAYARLGGYTPEGPQEYSVTLLDALKEHLGEDRVLYAKGSHIAKEADIDAAVRTAEEADAVIVALADNSSHYAGREWGDDEGGTVLTCGENFDCESLSLPESQKNLLRAVKKTGKPVILVLQTGRPYVLAEECEMSDAVLEAWYPGEEGGNAICRLLFGLAVPCGRLPISFPRSLGSIPCYYNYKPSARRLSGIPLDGKTEDTASLFPFGYGLSYTSFAYRDLNINGTTVSVTVENTGAYEAKETVLLFLTRHKGEVTPFIRQLKGIKKISLKPGESRTVVFELTDDAFSFIGQNMKKQRGSGVYTVAVGGLYADAEF